MQQDIENDLIIRDQMVNLGCLLVRTFGNFLAPALVAAHTVNNLDPGHEESFEYEGFESDKIGRQYCILYLYCCTIFPSRL